MGLQLKKRKGKKPEVGGYVPHQQLDQHSPKKIYQSLLKWIDTLPYVSKIKSRTTVSSAIGLYIDPDITINKKAEREFSHINTEPGIGSFHVKLPTSDLDIIIAKKWGVYHPMSEGIAGLDGKVGVALVYAPRDKKELKVAKSIITHAYNFAIGHKIKKNITTLMGFMGSGKTSIGRRLSKLSKIPFVDLDQYIELKEERSINEIFEQHGEDFFRLLETHYLRQFVKSNKAMILALGGGTPCTSRNWKMLKKTNSIYLKRSSDYLFENLKAKKDKRPLIKELSDGELKDLIQQKLNKRTSFYEKSDHIIDIDLSKKEIARIINDSIILNN